MRENWEVCCFTVPHEIFIYEKSTIWDSLWHVAETTNSKESKACDKIYLCSGNFAIRLASKPVMNFCAAWTFSEPTKKNKGYLWYP